MTETFTDGQGSAAAGSGGHTGAGLIGARSADLRAPDSLFDIIFHGVEDPILLVDVQAGATRLVIADINQSYSRLTGFQPEEVVGHELMDFLSTEDSTPIEAALRDAILARRAFDQKVQGHTADGGKRPVHLSMKPVFAAGNQLRYAVLLRRGDADGDEENGYNLHHISANIYARISHDLRTPLNAILGFSELLQMEVDQVEKAAGGVRQRDYASSIIAAGRELLGQIDEVLGLRELAVEDSRDGWEGVDIVDVMQDCAQRQSASARDSGVTVSMRYPDNIPTLYSDPRTLRQVIMATLGNAIAAAPAGSQIILGLKVTADGGLRLGCEDQGQRLSEADVDAHMDQVLGRRDAFTRSTKRVTTGIALIRRCMEVLGGTTLFDKGDEAGNQIGLEFPPGLVLRSR